MSSPSPVNFASIRATNLIFGLTLIGFFLFFIVDVVTRGFSRAMTPLAIFLTVAWIFSARGAWWTPVPVAVAVGGFIWAGFKIYLHEISILLAFAALAPIIALKVRVHGTGPVRLPRVVWVLFGYLAAHAIWAMVARYAGGEHGLNHLMRSYMDVLWAVMFTLAYGLYGNIRHVRIVLIIMFIALLIRSAFAVYQYFYPGHLIIRVFGSLFPIAPGKVTELRATSLLLIMLSFGFFFTTRSRTFKAVCLLVMAASAGMVLLGGSRVALVMVLLVPFVALAVRRKFLFIGACALTLVFGIAVLNLNPEIGDEMPRFMQRALSSLIFSERLAIHDSLSLSDYWHYHLMELGFKRWTESPLTFLFGTSIEPYDEAYASLSINFYDMADIAAKTARYEAALWTVLAPFGLVGFFLYAVTFWKLLRDPVRALFRDGLTSVHSVIYFCAFCQILLYVSFAWIAGGFPGLELVWAILAKAVHDDRFHAERHQAWLATRPNFDEKKRVTTMFHPL